MNSSRRDETEKLSLSSLRKVSTNFEERMAVHVVYALQNGKPFPKSKEPSEIQLTLS